MYGPRVGWGTVSRGAVAMVKGLAGAVIARKLGPAYHEHQVPLSRVLKTGGEEAVQGGEKTERFTTGASSWEGREGMLSQSPGQEQCQIILGSGDHAS